MCTCDRNFRGKDALGFVAVACLLWLPLGAIVVYGVTR